MATLRNTWDQTGKKQYETGVEKGVLYLYDANAEDSTKAYTDAVVWNGLISVSESPSGAEETALYADDKKYLSLRSKEEFGATIEAYTYPEEFEACDGSASIAKGVVIGQQARKTFGMSYVTMVGNDVNPDAGYKIHILYGCTASPSEKAYQTINDSPEAITFSWEISTVPVDVAGDFKATANVVIDSTKVEQAKLTALEDVLYGTESEDAHLPLPAEIMSIMGA